MSQEISHPPLYLIPNKFTCDYKINQKKTYVVHLDNIQLIDGEFQVYLKEYGLWFPKSHFLTSPFSIN